jgi:hypothetical protein
VSRPALAGSVFFAKSGQAGYFAQAGFSRFGKILHEQFVFGGGNWAQKSSNPEKLGRIRLRERKGR